MTSKKIIAICFICALTVFHLQGTRYEHDVSSDFKVGVFFKTAKMDIKLSDSELENQLQYAILGLRIGFDISDYSHFQLFGGYQENSLNIKIPFQNLPVLFVYPEDKSKSMVLGAALESELFSAGDFTFKLRGSLDYYKALVQQYDITLGDEKGTAESTHSFLNGTLSGFFLFEGFTGFTPFAGGHLNIISGNLEVKENILGFDSIEEMKYSQKNPFGVTAGLFWEWGTNMEVIAKINFISETSFSIALNYIL